MLRDDQEIIVQALKTAKSTLGELKRGYIVFDSVDAAENKADGQLLGTVFGIPIIRLASLDNGKFVYYSEAGATLASN